MSGHADDEPIGTSGIEEGHANVPLWLVLSVTALLIFFVVYIWQYA